MKIIKPQSKELERLCSRFSLTQKKRIKERVEMILNDVRPEW